MENRRRHKWDNYRRSQNKKPPRGASSWQPAVPSWEKEFCKVIGSLDWETLLQMKKFMHLYENVIKWNDSAGEDAFSNARKRFWAEMNGHPCDISLPDPDLYIDKINWDSETDLELQLKLEFEPIISNVDEDHDPVVIFGDSLLPNQTYSSSGWGDDDENFKVPANSSSTNRCSPCVQNWVNSFGNEATNAVGCPGYSSNAWHFGNGNVHGGCMTWEDSCNNQRGCSYSNNNMIYKEQPDTGHKMADGEQKLWNDSNVAGVNAGRYASAKKASRVQGNGCYRNNFNGRHKTTYWGQQSAIDKRPNAREWNSFNSCRPANHHAAITVGETWNQ